MPVDKIKIVQDNLNIILPQIKAGSGKFSYQCFESYPFSEDKWNMEHPMPTVDDLYLIYTSEVRRNEIKSAYDAMCADISLAMQCVYFTKSEGAASALFATWEAMVKRPTNYINADLGLNSEEEVLAFANGKLAEVDAYAVYRLNRIEQFRKEREQILNS